VTFPEETCYGKDCYYPWSQNWRTLGLILPHEHIFVEFSPPDHPEHAVAQVADVVALMAPEVEKAQALGVTAMVDCTPVGVGRRVDVLKAVSGGDGHAPGGAHRDLSRAQRAGLGTGRQRSRAGRLDAGRTAGEIEGSGVQAGWIKLSVGDDGITDCEAKSCARRPGRVEKPTP
jgi:phosphotriesterase-related protein